MICSILSPSFLRLVLLPVLIAGVFLEPREATVLYLKLLNVRWIWPTICLFSGCPGEDRLFPAHLAETEVRHTELISGYRELHFQEKGERETQKIVKV